ncbi:MAG TPA: hypothetical protein VIT00_07880 [Terrimicrobiaceae bacterium]
MANITVKSVLRRLHLIKGFVYWRIGWDSFVGDVLKVEVLERRAAQAVFGVRAQGRLPSK